LRRRGLLAQEDLLELDHAGVGEEQGRVVGRDEGRGRGAHGVLLGGEIIEEAAADFGRMHIIVK
jgi:hypothetical protein